MFRPAWFAAGFVAGAVGALVSAPAPIHPDGCTIPRVSKKIVTAFVLQPPAQEHLFCPSPIVQKPEPVSETIDAKAEEPVVEEEKPRRRHRHMRRHRRYW